MRIATAIVLAATACAAAHASAASASSSRPPSARQPAAGLPTVRRPAARMPPADASAARPVRSGRAAAADAPASAARLASGAPRAPVAPPLSVAPSAGEAGEQEGSGSPAGEADPLVANGLGSPSCRSEGIEASLEASERRNCQTSGFVGAAAPTADYGIDVHIDTGVLGLSSGGLLSAVQDLAVTPLWMAIVWLLHALVVMLEWSFSLDLLAGSASSVRTDLLHAQSGVTAPWLPLALALAAVLVGYRGLVQRRVADSLGEALAMAAMVAAGLWLVVDPAGTVGTVGRWADDAGEGTLAVAAQGSPAAPGAALGASMASLFATAVEAPWCYLEFGEVRWCKDSSMLESRLRATGLQIAARELREAGCKGACSSGGEAPRAVQASARLLREARTNGALFLALPANGPARNSINDSWSLLRALCGSEEATSCRGPTAAQAQFRTNSGTWSRVGGLLLITLGMLGLILLLGHLALRLLTAAVLSMLYLLLAPGMVLAPALGERGRALFSGWIVRLFAATVSKLIYAFLLGVVLTLMSLLGALEGLGWWAQWLLMSAFWWSAFLHRHQLRSLAGAPAPRAAAGRQRSVTRLLQTYGIARHSRRRDELGGPVLGPELPLREAREHSHFAGARRQRPHGHGVGAEAGIDGEAGERGIGLRRGAPPPASAAASSAPGRGSSPLPAGAGSASALDASRAGAAAQHGEAEHARLGQLARIEEALAGARRRGERRRVAQLELRRTRAAVPAGPSAGTDHAATLSPVFLAAQAALPARGAKDAQGDRRDYAALAQLAGTTPGRYAQLDPQRARAARLQIDRELAAHQAATPAVNEVWEDVLAVSDGRKRELGIGRP